MAIEIGIDKELLKCEMKKTYARVSENPDDRARLGRRSRLPG
jgi:hypothetical protein